MTASPECGRLFVVIEINHNISPALRGSRVGQPDQSRKVGALHCLPGGDLHHAAGPSSVRVVHVGA